MRMISLILIKLLKLKSPSLALIRGMKDIQDMTYTELWRELEE